MESQTQDRIKTINMERIVIEGTEDTPGLILDPAKQILSISGRSLPEDVTVFYQPVFEWLEQLKNQLSGDLTVEIKLEYFNTASSKILLDIFMLLEDMCDGEKSRARVNWHYDENDEDMLEAGEEYKEIVSLDFEMIGY